MTTSYVAGTVSVSAGGRTVTGVGTSWILANVAPGFFGLQGEIGPVIPVERVVSDTELLLYVDWPGATASGASYWLSYDTRDGQQSVNNAIRLSEYIARLDSDSLSAIAALSPEANTLIMYTGSNTAALIPTSQLGGLFDRQVPTIADRAQFDDRPQGFRVLVSNNGDGISALYTKDSAASGDWSEPAFITGPRGEQGPTGGFTSITAGATTTLPAGSDATVTPVEVSPGEIRLDFGLPRGEDGEGTGDVKGPPSSVTGRVAVFSGDDGKEISDSGVTLGYSASLDVGTTAGTVAAGNDSRFLTVGTTAGTVAAGDDPRFSQGGSSQNEAILALEIADLKGTRLGLKGGVADAFDDETGVDVKTNATYDATNDWYSPSIVVGTDQTATHTAATTSGNTASASTTNGGGYEAWRAFDKVQANASTNVGAWVTASVTTGWLQYRFATARAITDYSIKAGIAGAQSPRSWTLLGSNTGAFTGEQVVLDTRTAQTGWAAREIRRYSFSNGDSYLYYRINVTANDGDGSFLCIDEMTLESGTVINNMTLLSVAYPLASVPTTARMTLQTVESVGATPNTDFVAEFSRDGGTTWTAANLSLSPYLVVGSYKIYESQTFSVSGQPVGSNMKWRVRTMNNKNIAISGIVSQGG